jgi:SAM-dependent methyltransferase
MNYNGDMLETSLHNWLKTPLGAYVIEKEQLLIDELVSNIFGFNAVQAFLPQIDLLRSNRIPYRLRVGTSPEAQLIAQPHALPLATQSVDLVVLPHGLEFSSDPHAVLREMERILVPEGRLIITAFNPRSLWGLRQKLTWGERDYPWCGRFIPLSRLKDWLALLGFEVHQGRFWAYKPPLQNTGWRNRFQFMELAGDRWWGVGGGVYLLEAIKRVHGVRLITPRWNKRQVDPLISVPGVAVGQPNRISAKIIPLRVSPKVTEPSES